MKPFEGFTAETIDFLWELRMNNSREWMEENRDRYKRVLKEPFDSLRRQGNEMLRFPYQSRYPLFQG